MITIIDVVNYYGVPELNSISQRQAEFTDLIIFNKVEQVEDERKRQVVGYVREVNSAAPIIEAPHGHVHPSLLFGIYPSDLAGQTKMLELKRAEVERDQQLHQEGAEHSHLETDHVESFSLELHDVYDGSHVVRALSALPKQVFRVKGYLKLATAEGEKMMLINGVNQQIEVSDVPEGFVATQGVMVFIGFMMTQLRDQVEETLASAVLTNVTNVT